MKVHNFENPMMNEKTLKAGGNENNMMMMGASSTGGGMLNFDYGSMFDKNLDNYDYAIAGSGGSNQLGIFHAP